MDNVSLSDQDLAERSRSDGRGVTWIRRWKWPVGLALVAILLALAGVGGEQMWRTRQHSAAMAPPPQVTVSEPLRQMAQATGRFLGQFSAVDSVELRAQVGGALTAIGFQDG